LDTRLDALKDWIARVLGAGRFDIRPASADASFRRYFRVTAGQQSLIAMDAPPDKGDMHSYVAIARRFHALGLNVPEVLEENHDLGFFLITDLGDQLYLRHLSDRTVERLYGDAMGRWLSCRPAVSLRPPGNSCRTMMRRCSGVKWRSSANGTWDVIWA